VSEKLFGLVRNAINEYDNGAFKVVQPEVEMVNSEKSAIPF
jgi:hypothetical protein